MAIRFRKSKSLGGLGRVYLTKRGVSLSLGPRGKSISIGKRGVYGNIGIPGTGLSYRKKLYGSSKKSESKTSAGVYYESSSYKGYSMNKAIITCFVLFVLFIILTSLSASSVNESTGMLLIWCFVFLAWIVSVLWLPISLIKARKSKKAKIQAAKEHADALAYQQKIEEQRLQEEEAENLRVEQQKEAVRLRLIKQREVEQLRLERLQKQVNELTSQYEAGDYPIIDNPLIILKKNEICYLQYSASMHVRSKTTGFDKKSQGTIYLTNQRVIFLSDDKTTTFLLKSLVEIDKTTQEPVMLKLTKENIIPKYFHFGKGIEVYDFYILLKFLTINVDD